MRTRRPSSIIIKFLVALLVVLLIGFVPLRELLYPQPEIEIAEPARTKPRATIPTPTIPAAVPLPETPVPTPPGPLVEISHPIWAANRAENAIVRIDPDQNQVTGRVVVEGNLGPVTGGDGGVWAVVSSGRSQVNIIRLNADDLSIAATIPVYSGQVTCLQIGAGAVWAGVDQSAVDADGGGSILRIDTQSNEINAVIPRSGIPVEFASYAHTLWVLENGDQTNTIGRVDTTSLQVLAYPTAETDGMPATGFNHLSLGPAGIWATAQDGNDAYLYQLDPSTGDVLASIALGAADAGQAAALEAGEASVLVWLSKGTLLQVDPILQQGVNQVQIEPGMGKIHLRSGTIWIENESEAKVYRIEAQRLEVMDVFLIGTKPEPTPNPTPTQLPGTEPVCEARYPTRLTKGGKAVVNLEPPVPNRLRSEPDARAGITGQVEPGEIIHLIDGPVCANGWVWWYVQSRQSGIMGWTSEGDRNDYWLSPSE